MKTKLILLFFSTSIVFCAEPVPNVQNLGKQNKEEALAFFKSVQQERTATIQTLRNFLKDKKEVFSHRDLTAEVLDVINQLRAPELVEELVDVIRFSPTPIASRPFTPLDYPVVTTLVQIGMPSIKAVLQRALKEQDKATLTLYAAVINGVLGKELATEFITAKAKQDDHYGSLKDAYFSWTWAD